MAQENLNELTSVRDSVQSLINKTSEKSDFGKFHYTVNTHWEGGLLCNARIRNEHSLIIDEKPIMGL